MKTITGEVCGNLTIPPGASFDFKLTNSYREPRQLIGFKFDPRTPDDLYVNDIQVGKNSQFACSGRFKAELLEQFAQHDVYFDSPMSAMDVTLRLQSIPMAGEEANYAARARFLLGEGYRMPSVKTSPYIVPLPFPDERFTAWSQIPGSLNRIIMTREVAKHLVEDRIQIKAFETVMTHGHQDVACHDEIELELVKDEKLIAFLRPVGKAPPFNISAGVALKVESSERHTSSSEVLMLIDGTF